MPDPGAGTPTPPRRTARRASSPMRPTPGRQTSREPSPAPTHPRPNALGDFGALGVEPKHRRPGLRPGLLYLGQNAVR
jgi:hypothetical protein